MKKRCELLTEIISRSVSLLYTVTILPKIHFQSLQSDAARTNVQRAKGQQAGLVKKCSIDPKYLEAFYRSNRQYKNGDFFSCTIYGPKYKEEHATHIQEYIKNGEIETRYRRYDHRCPNQCIFSHQDVSVKHIGAHKFHNDGM